jgi:TonB family protein
LVEQPLPQKPPEKPPEKPQDTPPPDASDALTARQGAAPGNYGLQAGNGGGLRIGGRPGSGDAFLAYASRMQRELYEALMRDGEMRRMGFDVVLAVTVGPDGHIQSVKVIESSGNTGKDQAVVRILTGMQLSTPPPPGMQAVRWEFKQKPGA